MDNLNHPVALQQLRVFKPANDGVHVGPIDITDLRSSVLASHLSVVLTTLVQELEAGVGAQASVGASLHCGPRVAAGCQKLHLLGTLPEAAESGAGRLIVQIQQRQGGPIAISIPSAPAELVEAPLAVWYVWHRQVSVGQITRLVGDLLLHVQTLISHGSTIFGKLLVLLLGDTIKCKQTYCQCDSSHNEDYRHHKCLRLHFRSVGKQNGPFCRASKQFQARRRLSNVRRG
mmetsp:Transcript_43467/g.94673  ORF Transcript_43467/g.94673 Transcript_43467/m.94673 type:complete len:231 (-) Transcript_43467:287-979(-)